MEGKNIDIQLKGIVRNTPGAVCPDGELEEMINLRYKDGAFRPIPAALIYADVTGYSPIYVHSNSGYKHILGVANGALYWIGEETDGAYTPSETPSVLCSVTGTPSFTQIGNVVNILDPEGLKYVIWYDSKYLTINTAFDGSPTSTSLGPIGNVDIKVEGITRAGKRGIGAGVDATERDVRRYLSDVFSYESTWYFNEAKAARLDIVKGLFAKALGVEEKDGRLNGFFMACTAIELYDGSYIMQSNPVLCGQAFDKGTRYNFTTSLTPTTAYTHTYEYLTNRFKIVSGFYYDTEVRNYPLPDVDKLMTDGYMSFVADRVGIKGVGESPSVHTDQYPFLYADYSNYDKDFNQFVFGSYNIAVTVSSNKLQVRLHKAVPDTYKPLIKSLSVFITPQVSMYDFTEIAEFDNSVSGYGEYTPIIKTNDTIIKEILDLKTFYKVHEVLFDELNANIGGWIDVELKDKLGDSLTTMEAMPGDPFSHQTVLPEYQFVYNSKLHVANYKTLFSRGWPVGYLFHQNGNGQFPSGLPTLLSGRTVLKTYLKAEQGTSTVCRIWTADSGSLQELGALVSYPDIRAIRVEMYLESESAIGFFYKVLDLKLTPNDFNNFSMFVDPSLKPISFSSGGALYPASEVLAENQREQTYPNAFKASEINNPFTFPAASTHQVGNGEIRAFASNTIALSTGQYGEHPLYVFCSDGVYAMYVGGGAITYTSSKPVARDVCNNPASVKAIDGGVVFSTDRGAMLISGAQVTELSLPLRGAFMDFTNAESTDYIRLFTLALDNIKLTTLKADMSAESFLTYLKKAKVGYNHKEREIWFSDPAKSYSYVCSKGVWYKVKATGEMFVEDYPNQYLLSNGILLDIGKESTSPVQTMFLSRPLKVGTQGFKQAMRTVIRGSFTTTDVMHLVEGESVLDYSKYVGVYVCGSYDSIKWAFLGGTENHGTPRDLGTTIERVDCKYFRIGFVGELSPDSAIEYIELSVKAKLQEKIR